MVHITSLLSIYYSLQLLDLKFLDTATTMSGVILLGGYLLLDSFTSNWQNMLFVEYGVTSIQMMCAVNMFSCLLTSMSLFQQSSFQHAFEFMIKVSQFDLSISRFYNLLS